MVRKLKQVMVCIFLEPDGWLAQRQKNSKKKKIILSDVMGELQRAPEQIIAPAATQ